MLESRNPPDATVRKTLSIGCSVAHAFTVFTEKMGQWWPATHHVGDVPFVEINLDRRTGGAWYEINANGERGEWGHVLAWEPPHRVILSWHLDAKFQYHPELERASELELRFIEEGPSRTRVELTHRHLERHGEGYEGLRELLDGGWVGVMAQFQELAEATRVKT
ncbi:MAG: SRPBCC family protein [Burkholderiaceae bacterium]|jgi:uncharacterized protein YndB with AHSA1/START domain